jgi:hypothetical protein
MVFSVPDPQAYGHIYAREWFHLARRREDKCLQPFARNCAPHRNACLKVALDRRGFCDTLMTTGFVIGLYRRSGMSIESHLVELTRRHRALEREIEGERNHPASNEIKLKELKRKKLHLKEEIEKIKQKTAA